MWSERTGDGGFGDGGLLSESAELEQVLGR